MRVSSLFPQCKFQEGTRVVQFWLQALLAVKPSGWLVLSQSLELSLKPDTALQRSVVSLKSQCPGELSVTVINTGSQAPWEEKVYWACFQLTVQHQENLETGTKVEGLPLGLLGLLSY